MAGDDLGTTPDGSQIHRPIAFELQLLGPLLVEVDGRALAIGSGRVAKTLALLGINANKIVSVDQVVDLLWEVPPESARQQVHNVVSGIRKALKPAGGTVTVSTMDIGYKLNVPNDAVDVVRFEQRLLEAESAVASGELDEASRHLRQALALWRGPALSGLDAPKLLSAATLLTEKRVAAVERLSEISIASNRAASVVAILAELVGDHPLREPLRALLMRALHSIGRQADALVVYEEGRRRLADELGLDPGPRLREAHQAVLDNHHNRESINPTRRTASERLTAQVAKRSGARSANFLPRDLAEFTGREVEVSHLLAHAANAKSAALTISAINGMGGVGKTTLAVHLAHQLTDRFPDAQLFVDLQGFSVGVEPLSPMLALKILLRSIGIQPEAIPPDLAARSALWRSTLTGRRALVVLDNAFDVAQVRPLLPAEPGTLVLMTSRRRMTALEGAIPLPLDPMSKDEAFQLFSRILGPDRVAAEPESTAAVLELCGGLPLAIHIAAARLRDRPSWSIADMFRQLRTRGGRARALATGDRNVMTVIGWSDRHLPSTQRMLFRRLSAHPEPDFDASAAAAISGLPLEQVEDGLEDLLDVNLLQQQRAGRYSFHDLARDCTRDSHFLDDAWERSDSTPGARLGSRPVTS